MRDWGAYSPLIKRLLDGEIGLEDLPAELREEGASALRLFEPGWGEGPALSPAFEQRVMAEVRRNPAPRRAGAWAWLSEPREIRLHLQVRPWAVAAAAALVVLALARWAGPGPAPARLASAADSSYVRFVLYAPSVGSVAVAGSFNQWDPARTPLAPAGTSGFWTATVALPPGQHQYAFVVNGAEWIPDPVAPAVNDGFGRRNSVVTVPGPGGRAL
jgi:hypothetical protein